MQLEDTVELMTSSDYRDRFKAEYYQNHIRIMKLKAVIEKIHNGTIEFEPVCQVELLEAQLNAMKEYQAFLVVRSKLENIF